MFMPSRSQYQCTCHNNNQFLQFEHVVERAIADHGLHASVPHFQQEGHGCLREQPLYDHHPLAAGNDGNRPKYSPAHQPILKRNRYLCPIRRKTINF